MLRTVAQVARCVVVLPLYVLGLLAAILWDRITGGPGR